MSGSTLTAFNYIPELSEATPGLWNSVFSVLSQNIAEANSTGTIVSNISTVGMVTINANSNVTNYLFLNDSSAQRSDYIIGSQVGGTADGLNIYDVSGATMIVSFSKQSVRFYQQVIGPVFDLGGALTGTYNAKVFQTASASTESAIQAAINQASLDGVPRVYVPSSMYPYSASSISFIYTVQMIREGGDLSAYDVQAYGADAKGVLSSTSAFAAWLATSPVGVISSGTYRCGQITDTSAGRREIVGNAGAVIRNTDATWLKIVPTAAKTGIRLKNLTISVTTSAQTAVPLIWLEGSSAGGVVDIEIDSIDYGDLTGISADLLWLRACFNGRVSNQYAVNANNCRGILYGAKNFNSGNILFDTIAFADAGVGIQLGQAWAGANQSLLNQVTLTNCKGVRTAPGTGADIEVTLTSRATSGDTQLTVSAPDATLVAAAITAGTPQWAVCADSTPTTGDVISVTAASGVTLSLATAIPQTLANGTIIPIGTHAMVVLANTFGVVSVNPQFESVGFGATLSGPGQVTILGAQMPGSATIQQRGVYCTNGTIDVVVQQPIYSKAGTQATLLYATAQGGNANCQLIEPVGYSAGAGPTFVNNQANPSGTIKFKRLMAAEATVTLTYGTTITPDESYENNKVTVTDGVAFTVAVPANRCVGVFTLDFYNNSGGAMGVVTFNAIYKLAGAFVAPANGFHRCYTFREDAGNIHEVSRTGADVPN